MRHTRAFVRKPTTQVSRDLIELDKRRLRVAVGIITGHWLTRRHMKMLGRGEESACRWRGEEEETPLHMIRECSGLREPRQCLLGNLGTDASILETLAIKAVMMSEYASLFEIPFISEII
ncbi:CinsV4_orph1 protein [Chelonus insularis]|nr:CinsV4_orph1 protein [Chelonus insularis]